MAGLANVLFRNVFTHLNGGIQPQQLATGTTSGSAIQLGGLGPIGKLTFRAFASMIDSHTSNSGAMSLYLATATASGASYTSLSQTLASVSVSNSAKLYVLEIDARNEAFANLGTATNTAKALWVKPVVALATAVIPFAIDVLGWEVGTDPASTWDGTSLVVTETDFY